MMLPVPLLLPLTVLPASVLPPHPRINVETATEYQLPMSLLKQ